MTRLFPWPRALTKTPERPSIYQRPWLSRTRMPLPSARISGSSPKAFIWTKSTISRRVSELRSSSTVAILLCRRSRCGRQVAKRVDTGFDQLVNFAQVDVRVGHAVGPAEPVLVEDFL